MFYTNAAMLKTTSSPAPPTPPLGRCIPPLPWRGLWGIAIVDAQQLDFVAANPVEFLEQAFAVVQPDHDIAAWLGLDAGGDDHQSPVR